MASIRKPNQSDIDTATHIREQVREAAESRDFAINEARRKYPAQINLIKHARYSRYMRDWFAGIRKTIYRQLRQKYPNMSAETWKLLYRLMGERINVRILLTEDITRATNISLRWKPFLFVGVKVYHAGDDQILTEEEAGAIFYAFKMARTMCAGVLKITVFRLGWNGSIRVR